MPRADDFVLVQGLRDTRGTLQRWNAAPWSVLRGWLLWSTIVSVGLLLAVLAVALLSTPDATPLAFPGLNVPAGMDDVVHVLQRNALVLALHGFACVAGFIAGSSMPMEAQKYTGVVRWIHDKAGPGAMIFVGAATLFSLITQALVLGAGARTLAAQGDISPALLLVGLLPHALPELIALFLPLAAWMIASRNDDWHELLAATFVTVGLAVPVLIVTSFVEVYVSPHFILFLRG